MQFEKEKFNKLIAQLFFIVTLSTFYGCETTDSKDDGAEEQDTAAKTHSIESINFLKTLKIGEEGAAEITTFDKKSMNLYVVNNADVSKIDIVDLKDPASPALNGSIDVSSYGGGVNSVAANKGLLAAAIEGNSKQDNGRIVVFDTKDHSQVANIEAGALPDMVTFSPDGKWILSANEGEPNDEYTNDPEGSVTIIDVKNNYQATQVQFNGFSKEQLISKGVRIFGPNASVAQDLEPEYIAISEDSKIAWVAFQENNGMARIDIESKSVTDIFSFGLKDYSLEENSLDASNKDDLPGNFKTWPIVGMYQPDAIGYFSKDSKDYIVTANEGDAREYLTELDDGTEVEHYVEETRVKSLNLDPEKFPNAEMLQKEENLGRIKTTLANGDTDGDGDHDSIYVYGGRSFSIFDGTTGQLIYDSKNIIGKTTFAEKPEIFNQDEGEVDGRSDDKGAEPEGLAIAQLKDKTYAFVGLERTGGVMVFDITDPANATYIDWLIADGDIAPEGLLFIDEKDSPSKKPLLVVSNEVSGTISIYEMN